LLSVPSASLQVNAVLSPGALAPLLLDTPDAFPEMSKSTNYCCESVIVKKNRQRHSNGWVKSASSKL